MVSSTADKPYMLQLELFPQKLKNSFLVCVSSIFKMLTFSCPTQFLCLRKVCLYIRGTLLGSSFFSLLAYLLHKTYTAGNLKKDTNVLIAFLLGGHMKFIYYH